MDLLGVVIPRKKLVVAATAGIKWDPDPVKKSGNITLSNDGYTATGTANFSQSVLGDTEAGLDKTYCEVSVNYGAGGTGVFVGMASYRSSDAVIPGNTAGDPNSISYSTSSGSIFFNGATTSGPATTTGSTFVIGIATDRTLGRIWFSRNGVFAGDPLAGTGGVAFNPAAWFPLVTPKNTESGTINGGSSAFVHAPPSGYVAAKT